MLQVGGSASGCVSSGLHTSAARSTVFAVAVAGSVCTAQLRDMHKQLQVSLLKGALHAVTSPVWTGTANGACPD